MQVLSYYYSCMYAYMHACMYVHTDGNHVFRYTYIKLKDIAIQRTGKGISDQVLVEFQPTVIVQSQPVNHETLNKEYSSV